MLPRCIACGIVVLASSLCHAEEETQFKARADAWAKELAGREFAFGEQMAQLAYSLGTHQDLEPKSEIHVVLRQERKSLFPANAFLQIWRDGKKLVEADAHLGCSFQIFDGVLYLARSHVATMGCTMTACSMTDGSIVWTTDKLGIPPQSHSAYGNEAYITLSRPREVPGEERGDSIILRGRESYGDYMTVLDRRTGKILANRVFREGFGSDRTEE
jgi:hypothetical protein